MTSAEVHAIRTALGAALGRRMSQADLGRLLQLAPANGADTVRSWEDGKRAVTGPAAVALRLLGYGAGVGIVPNQISDHGADAGGVDELDYNKIGADEADRVFRAVMLGIAESMLDVEQKEER